MVSVQRDRLVRPDNMRRPVPEVTEVRLGTARKWLGPGQKMVRPLKLGGQVRCQVCILGWPYLFSSFDEFSSQVRLPGPAQ